MRHKLSVMRLQHIPKDRIGGSQHTHQPLICSSKFSDNIADLFIDPPARFIPHELQLKLQILSICRSNGKTIRVELTRCLELQLSSLKRIGQNRGEGTIH